MKKLTVTITFEIDCVEYGQSNTPESAVDIAANIIRGNADWPDGEKKVACENYKGLVY